LRQRLHEFLADGECYRTADDLTATATPVLLLWGRNDKITPLHQAQSFLDQLPDAYLKELPGVGHFPHFDEPATHSPDPACNG